VREKRFTFLFLLRLSYVNKLAEEKQTIQYSKKIIILEATGKQKLTKLTAVQDHRLNEMSQKDRATRRVI